jgi:HPt (histidine-containing phosphotransfer) domain-containing protein
MAELHAVISEPPRSSPTSVERPIDLVHLARMTLGERSLEREVLELFDSQATVLLARMRRAGAAGVPALAHTLKGSARAIGAVRVAGAAEALELAIPASEAELARALANLDAVIEDARAFIAELLRAH